MLLTFNCHLCKTGIPNTDSLIWYFRLKKNLCFWKDWNCMTAIFCVGPFTWVKNSHSSRGITLRYYFCAIQTLKHFPDKIYPYFFNYPISSPSNLQRINWWYFIFFGLITHTSNAMHCLYCFDNRKPSIKCDKFWAMFILRLVRENFIKSVSRRCWSCAPLLAAKNN